MTSLISVVRNELMYVQGTIRNLQRDIEDLTNVTVQKELALILAQRREEELVRDLRRMEDYYG